MPASYHFLSTPPPFLGLRAVPSDFAGYSVIVPMSLIPPTLLRTAFFAIYAIPSPYSLVCFCLGNISQTSLKTESLGTYGNALVGITFKNYLDRSSSCCVYTQRLPREEAMRGNGMLGAGQGWGVLRGNPKTAGIWQVTNYMLSTSFPIKILSFACPHSEEEEPKRKMFAETETTRVT